MELTKMIFGLLATLAPREHANRVRGDQLERIIDKLQRQEAELTTNLTKATGGARIRHLKIAIKVAHLQRQKALALRRELTEH